MNNELATIVFDVRDVKFLPFLLQLEPKWTRNFRPSSVYIGLKPKMLSWTLINCKNHFSLWLCTLSLAVAVGAALLLPFSIASNEVLLLYPNSYYVKWLNISLVQGTYSSTSWRLFHSIKIDAFYRSMELCVLVGEFVAVHIFAIRVPVLRVVGVRWT